MFPCAPATAYRSRHRAVAAMATRWRRQPELVREDVRLGYYTAEEAAQKFGVVIADGKIDQTGTARACVLRWLGTEV